MIDAISVNDQGTSYGNNLALIRSMAPVSLKLFANNYSAWALRIDGAKQDADKFADAAEPRMGTDP